MEKKYQPINCNVYDQLEAYATLKKEVEISYSKDNVEVNIRSVIKDLYTRQKEEFLLLDNEQEIRLDHILSITPTKK